MPHAAEITIRPVQVSDAKELLAFFQQVWAETTFLIREPGETQTSIEEEENTLQTIRSDPRKETWVAIASGNIIGVCSLYPFEQRRLYHRAGIGLSVKQAYWGNHVASRLLEAMLEHAKQHDITCVELEVSKKNSVGIGLYKKFGFVTFGEYDKFMKVNGTYVGAYYMYKDIEKEVKC